MFVLQKLIRMNMPVDENGTVHFTTTLFALIRESLGIKMGPPEVMDQRDNELRYSLLKLWPVQAKRMLKILVPPDSGQITESFDFSFEMFIYFLSSSIIESLLRWIINLR